jgi:hypothetical protein
MEEAELSCLRARSALGPTSLVWMARPPGSTTSSGATMTSSSLDPVLVPE